MKKKILIGVLCSSYAFSQTVITKNFNDPVVGDSYNSVIVSGIDASVSGNNVVFSFPSAKAESNSTQVKYVLPTSQEIATYPGTTLKDNMGVFYKQSANKLEITGLSASAGNYALIANFSSDNATAMTYNTAFGFSGTDNLKGTFSADVGTQISGYLKGNVVTTADGYGTLVLGNKSFPNVLRVKNVQAINLYLDSFYILSIGSITDTTYRYFDAGHKFPLLTYSETTIKVPSNNIDETRSSAVGLESLLLSAKSETPKSEVAFYPNPVKDILRFSEDMYDVTIRNSSGNILFKNYKLSPSIDLKQLEKGVYLITGKTKTGQMLTKKIIKN